MYQRKLVMTCTYALRLHRGDRGPLPDRYRPRPVPGTTGKQPVCEQALGIYRDIGDRLGQANALLYLGAVRRDTGDFPGAARGLEQAPAMYPDLPTPHR